MADQPERPAEPLARPALRRQLLGAGGLVLVSLAAAAIALVQTNGGANPGTRTVSLFAPPRAPAAAAGEVRPAHRLRGATSQLGWTRHRGSVPILEYQLRGSPAAGAPNPELYVTRRDFQRQMNWLARHGYQAVTLEQVERAWYHGASLPGKPIVLSFDEGYHPQLASALSELRRHGWAGVLGLKAEGSELPPSKIRAMIAAGWELAAQPIRQLDLTTLGPAELKQEVAGSRARLRDHYGVPVRDFSAPAGRFDRQVFAALKAAGYVGATTEEPGFASRTRPYQLNRFEIRGSTGIPGLARDLRAG